MLGWYTEQAVARDSAAVLNGGEESSAQDTLADIRLLDFDASGSPMQGLPDSISQVADGYDVSITSNFRFTKNAETIDDLSILWVERAEGRCRKLAGQEGSAAEPGNEADAADGAGCAQGHQVLHLRPQRRGEPPPRGGCGGEGGGTRWSPFCAPYE